MVLFVACTANLTNLKKKDAHHRQPHITVLLVPKQLCVTRAVIDRIRFGFRCLKVQNCVYHLSKRHMNQRVVDVLIAR